ncbi:MAG: hypothetical protein QM785_10025 [Pyrinomonadaceae bacterium]
MQRTLIIFAILTAIALLVTDGNAQSQKRIGLPEGADSVEVTGKVTGKQFVLYETWADKGDEWSVDLDSTNQFIGYTVKGPNGDRYDFLETAPTSGYYVIRVELNATGARSKKPAPFTLKIKFEMEPGKPIS